MWVGEQITRAGIGNGISLIIFVGILAEVRSGGAVPEPGPVRRDQPAW
jgi:preprotein translocase subunit SecY